MAVKKTVRRHQIRQKRGTRSPSRWQRIRDSVGMAPLLSGVLFLVGSSAIAFSWAQFGRTGRYAVGQKVDQPIYAAVGFEIQDENETHRRRQAARAAAPSHYRTNHELIAGIGTELQDLYQAAQGAETFEAFTEIADSRGWRVEQPGYEELRSYANESAKARFKKSIDRLRSRLPTEYTWDRTSAAQRTPASTAEFVIVHDRKEDNAESASTKEVRVFNLTPISNVTNLRRAGDAYARLFAGELQTTISDILVARLSTTPMLVLDIARTNEEMDSRETAVEPEVIRYERARPMIPPRTEQGLTAADMELLIQHDKAYLAYMNSSEPGGRALRERALFRRVGITTIFVLCTVGLFSYIGMYHPRILQVNTRCVSLVVLLLAVLLAAKLIDARLTVREFIYGPPLFAASVLAVAYTRRMAVGLMTIVAVMIALSVSGDVAMLVTMVIGIVATVQLLSEIRTRTRLLWVGAISAAAVFASATAFGLADGQTIGFAAKRGGWAGCTALLSAMLVQAALPLIEKVFRIATSLTLLEWRDPTRPLLQRLAREAPGTYTHSLALGAMAEAACETIGANGLLAQVGALYHDIGKLNKPEYFAENQEANINRHDKLAPTMSVLIIIGHVKDGIEMAKEYRLPRVLQQFVAEHHGTTVVRYFHHIASEKQPQIASGKHDREVSEARFRYPGPKPRSKESAVLMVCDGTEGAVRALPDPTPGRIEQTVHQILTQRLDDGQFDDCDITLRELHRVEESLVKTLASYHHGRVAYPKKEKPERSVTSEQEAERKSIAG